MKNRKSTLITLILLAVLLNTGLGLYNIWKQPHIAYVRSADLVYEFEGMKEAQKKFEAQSKSWDTNIETLKSELQASIDGYKANLKKMSAGEKTAEEEKITLQQQNLTRYMKSIEQKREDADNEMTQAVLNQINSFVEEFGQNKGFDMILGTTTSGNLLYAKDAIDITDEVLAALNKSYKGQS
ncbi:MAG: OmpH family outer membrane protein [Flavobacteriales bacterium]|nr:OmpH family outer membrane protein [Flavobacteriales bacterium]MCB9448332.1 OmpH family outer membrane protein [Flavobacteriales bacterium]